MPRPQPFLTARRLRAHGIILALCFWSVYIWNISTPGLRDRGGNLKGTDFLHFYTLGSLAMDHRGADLYDLHIQYAVSVARVPAAAGVYYLPLYPPQVSILFAPFAKLDYSMALICWLILSAAIYGICCFALLRACPNLRGYQTTVLILALAYPAFWHLIAWGQTSALALACFTLAFFALRGERDFYAGLALGCLIFKPQVALALAIVFLLTWRWKVIVGALVSSLAQLTVAWLYYGLGPLHDWLHALSHVSNELAWFEPRLYQTHCLRTFWEMLIPWPHVSVALYLVSAAFVAALSVSCWRSQLPLSVRFSSLLFATVLLAPHLTVYDLVILTPAFLLLADWIVDKAKVCVSGHFPLLLYLAFVLPLVGPLARWTHVQLSVLVMAAVLFEIWSCGKNPRPSVTEPQPA
jgi:Glycosyltransferase family 87